MISENLRERYNIPQKQALPIFFLDCHYDEDNDDEKTAFAAAFTNTIISAKQNEPYNAQGATAAKPKNVKLEQEKKALEEEKVSLVKVAKDSELKAKKEA